MSQVKIRHPIQLIKYFVFNTTWGTKEGDEHEKLIYYYAKPTMIIGADQKISDANDSRIDSYIFIYNDQLVSSSLSLFDTQILYNYLTNIVIPDAVKEEISGISNKTRWLQVDFPIYLIGHPEHRSSFRNLCLFRSINGSTIGLILTEFDENILKECGTLLSGRLVSLTNKLHETVTQIAKQPDSKSLTNDNSSGKDIKFIYVNYSNCAQRGNSNCRKLIDSDFTRLIIDVESDLQQRFTDEQVFELIGKNMNDAWLVSRNSDYRALFAMLNYKNANLIEASDMIDAMQNKHFKNLFFGI
ncbi:vacuolar fusion protein CCZ1-like protein [Euroglyphus maynei]|uniref:Vacuolar fusion protein CCZ1-like protein n=1 Tax=Euroglyphus maynei TaxID=6958 RepID=A0A1Y3AZE4_EURMA|nr:vacuolar fusion protein CCZ1-like protein [Euroglyphus maynei]